MTRTAKCAFSFAETTSKISGTFVMVYYCILLCSEMSTAFNYRRWPPPHNNNNNRNRQTIQPGANNKIHRDQLLPNKIDNPIRIAENRIGYQQSFEFHSGDEFERTFDQYQGSQTVPTDHQSNYGSRPSMDDVVILKPFWGPPPLKNDRTTTNNAEKIQSDTGSIFHSTKYSASHNQSPALPRTDLDKSPQIRFDIKEGADDYGMAIYNKKPGQYNSPHQPQSMYTGGLNDLSTPFLLALIPLALVLGAAASFGLASIIGKDSNPVAIAQQQQQQDSNNNNNNNLIDLIITILSGGGYCSSCCTITTTTTTTPASTAALSLRKINIKL